MDLQVYQVDTFPSPGKVRPPTITDFQTRYLGTLIGDTTESQSARAFVADRVLARTFRKKVNYPVVHEEAAAMGLICISLFGGETFGEFTKEWVDKALPVCF